MTIKASMSRMSVAAVLLAGAVALSPVAASAEDSGAAAGAIAGGTAGAVVGGPVGAAVGAGAGAVIGGAASGPNRSVVIEQRDTTGTIATPCESRTVERQNALGDTKTTTTTNCP